MDDREELLATVASLYYTLHQSQAEIADRFGVSTSKISRMLKEARDRGIVDIRIHMPIPRDVALEQEMIRSFGLRDALVLQSNPEADDESALLQTARLAAAWLQRALLGLPRGSTVGVAWGASVHATVAALREVGEQEMDAVQLIGGVGLHSVDSPDITRTLALKLGGRHYDLPAPILVEQAASGDILRAEPSVREGLLRARSVQLAIAGIGAVQAPSSSLLRAGLLTSADLEHLRKQGAVGEMVGRFYRFDGTIDGIDLNQRIIGLDLDELRRIPASLAIARGLPKVAPILGALRGRLVSVLATDDQTARSVLALAHETEVRHP